MELLSTKVQVAAGQSLFLATVAKQGHTAQTLVAVFASNSGAMRAGYKSKILGIDYTETAGNVPNLARDQTTIIDGETLVIQPMTDANGKPNKPKAPALIFEVGKQTMTLGLLQQAQDKTRITFKGFEGGDVTKGSTELTLEDLGRFPGNTFECKKYWREASITITRNGPDDKPANSYPANAYEIVITKA